LLRDYHSAIGKIIVKYNGTLERHAIELFTKRPDRASDQGIASARSSSVVEGASSGSRSAHAYVITG